MGPDILNQKVDLFPSSANKINADIEELSLYECHFGLKEKPFKLTPDPKYFYMSKHHQEALAHLVFSIQENKGFVTITGEVGTGKTTLCRSFLNHLDNNIKVAYIFNPCLTDVELLQNINDEFAVPANNDSKKLLIDELNKYLLGEKRKGNKVIVIVDEAQNLSPNVLEQLRLLSNLETETDKLIQIILIGQPELENTLSRPDLRQLKQRITIDWELLPLDKNETSMYIQHRTKIAGGNGKLTFTRNAMGKIHNYSQGIPRLINVLADRALVIAFALGKKQIDSKIIQFAIKDLKKKRVNSLKKNNRIKLTIVSGLLLLVFLYLGVFLYLSQKETISEVIKSGSTEDSIDIKLDSLPKESVVPIPDSKPNETPVLNVVSPPEKTPLPSTPPLPDGSLVIRTKQEFANFLMQIADESKLNSIAAVLDIWGFPPPPTDELEKVNFTWLKENRGLSFFKIDSDLERLKIFNYPAVLLFPPILSPNPSFLLLVEEQNDYLTFVSKEKRTRVLKEIVKEAWTGRAYIFWKNFEGFDETMKKGARGFEVIWLSKKMKELGFYDHKATKVFNENLKKAVIKFQKENKLKSDGVVGKETKIILYNKLGIYKTPHLG